MISISVNSIIYAVQTYAAVPVRKERKPEAISPVQTHDKTTEIKPVEETERSCGSSLDSNLNIIDIRI